jgi:hypothetical protein
MMLAAGMADSRYRSRGGLLERSRTITNTFHDAEVHEGGTVHLDLLGSESNPARVRTVKHSKGLQMSHST